jgi:predicted Zn-ribbon and HTH transcriptional regulator
MMTKHRLSRRELERLLYDASEALNSVLEDCFPTTPEGVAAEEERQRREGPIELPESLRNASKVLERIQENQKRRCPKCGKVGQMFTADLDWCPACKHQWPGA